MATLSRDRVPPWLTAIILRCLAKHPDDRYPSARAVLEAIRDGRSAGLSTPVPGAVQDDGAAPARLPAASSEDETPTAAMPRARRRGGRRRALVALGLVAVVGALWASRAAARHRWWCTTVSRSPSRSRSTTPASPCARATACACRCGRAEPLEAHWAMVRPTAGTGRPLGGEVEGSIVADDVRGDVREVVAAGTGGRPRFAPLVVNRTRPTHRAPRS